MGVENVLDASGFFLFFLAWIHGRRLEGQILGRESIDGGLASLSKVYSPLPTLHWKKKKWPEYDSVGMCVLTCYAVGAVHCWMSLGGTE
jgi:hypothetical protein